MSSQEQKFRNLLQLLATSASGLKWEPWYPDSGKVCFRVLITRYRVGLEEDRVRLFNAEDEQVAEWEPYEPGDCSNLQKAFESARRVAMRADEAIEAILRELKKSE